MPNTATIELAVRTDRAMPGLKQITNGLKDVEVQANRARGGMALPPVPSTVPKSLATATGAARTLGYALNDAQAFAFSFQSGVAGISNQIPMLSEQFQKLKAETGSSKAALQALMGAFTGPAGILNLLSLTVIAAGVLGPKLAGMFEGGKEEAEKFVKALDGVLAKMLEINRTEFTFGIEESEIEGVLGEINKQIDDINAKLGKDAQGRLQEAITSTTDGPLREMLSITQEERAELEEQLVVRQNLVGMLEEELTISRAIATAREALQKTQSALVPLPAHNTNHEATNRAIMADETERLAEATEALAAAEEERTRQREKDKAVAREAAATMEEEALAIREVADAIRDLIDANQDLEREKDKNRDRDNQSEQDAQLRKMIDMEKERARQGKERQEEREKEAATEDKLAQIEQRRQAILLENVALQASEVEALRDLINVVRDAIKAEIARRLAEVVGNALVSVPFPFNIALAAGAGGAAALLFEKVVPKFAAGGTMSHTGMALVGERGPELVNLHAGARVFPHEQSMRMMGGDNSALIDRLDRMEAAILRVANRPFRVDGHHVADDLERGRFLEPIIARQVETSLAKRSSL